SRQPVIKSLGTSAATSTQGPSRAFGAAVTLVLFGVFCYVLLVLGGVRQRARRPARAPAEPAGELVADPYLEIAGDDGAAEPPVPIANGNGTADATDGSRFKKHSGQHGQHGQHAQLKTATRRAY